MNTERVILISIISVALMIVGFSLYLTIQESLSPTFELRKNEWQCTKTHTITRVLFVGKVIIPRLDTVCDRWDRI